MGPKKFPKFCHGWGFHVAHENFSQFLLDHWKNFENFYKGGLKPYLKMSYIQKSASEST